MCDEAAQDERLLAITPAMCEGSGMVKFAKQFPQRFFDVAIAEQHAVTLAAGMACEVPNLLLQFIQHSCSAATISLFMMLLYKTLM